MDNIRFSKKRNKSMKKLKTLCRFVMKHIPLVLLVFCLLCLLIPGDHQIIFLGIHVCNILYAYKYLIPLVRSKSCKELIERKPDSSLFSGLVMFSSLLYSGLSYMKQLKVTNDLSYLQSFDNLICWIGVLVIFELYCAYDKKKEELQLS